MSNLKGFGCNVFVEIVYQKSSKETIWIAGWLEGMRG